VRAVAPVARRAQVPVIAFSNDVSVAGDGVYVMGFNPGQTTDRVVAFARSRGVQRFGALLPTGVYGQRVGQALTSAVEAAGGQVAGMQSYESSAAGLSAAATRLNGQGRFDAVLIADGAQMAVPAVPIVPQATPQPPDLGTELLGDRRPISVLTSACAAPGSRPRPTSISARSGPATAPVTIATLSGSRASATTPSCWRSGSPRTGRSAALPGDGAERPTGFVGVDGAFRFGRDGVAEHALEVREVNANGSTVVSPAPRGFN
jgi:hypothetical protein